MKTAVLVMSYGSPRDANELLVYYTDIRRGRPPSDEELADLRRRYDAIGGLSPLNERSTAQVAALKRKLDALHPGSFSVFYGTKHARPSIDEAIDEIARSGLDRLIGLVLAPHYSELSVGEYISQAKIAAQASGIDATFIEHWHDLPELIDLLTGRIHETREDLEDLKSAHHRAAEVIFTAHSLPARIIAEGDPYIGELETTARLVAERVGLSHYRLGWQSAARTREPWLGPDITELLGELAESGTKDVIICPQGFTADHLEILYDLDIVAAGVASSLGMAFRRTRSLNDDPVLAHGLAQAVIVHCEHTWPNETSG